ncbi:HK97 gp10 family phage protein [Sphingomonas olei]|uniref:HK97 gp10 family phage protein n=1 Tax=Sphingomonas olei TaxID=1886787 RepID=A0ABY2QIG7_9SPHN|nr:HK97 gp10 family phage protein [Sphingomonas olei]THG40439.1 HK97 gp10 family phage protein [Sphingomonas olei]
MAKVRGGAATRRYMTQLPELLRERVLRGAARAGAKVIAEGAKERLGGRTAEGPGGADVLIANSVKVQVKLKGEIVRGRILLRGPGAYVGRWLEYGTDPHFISVDPQYRQGMTARRINKRISDGDDGLKATLMINGKPVGTSVWHKGARKVPFLRPAVDTLEREAIAAAQAYIDVRIAKGLIGHNAGPEIEDDE